MSSLIDVSENTDPHDVPYRLRLRVVDGNDNHRLVDISEHPEVTEETRKRWILKVTDYIWGPRSDHSFTAIRPWDFIVSVDGAVESLPVSDVNRKGNGMYPPRYRIPPTSIQSLEEKEKVRRQERFAFASLLYEIGCNKKPFEELNDEELQQRYSDADFPEDVRSLPLPLFINILSNWSVEFANIINSPTSTLTKISTGLRSYVQAHPYLFAVQATGALVGVAAAATPAALAALGFSAFGPVAGSVAAGWQASLGVVQAGSLFAWCQSAAMGGAALNGVAATGIAGGGAAALATAGAAVQGGEKEKQEMMNRFQEVFRRG